MRVVRDLTELIGQTPIMELGRLYPDARARVYAKLEMFNPMSNKDRPVLYMIRSAQAKGLITPNTEVVEASSGNTAIAAASLGAIMNFPVRIFMSESVSIERQLALAAFGAKVILTPAAEYTRGARERAIAYCKRNPSTTFYLGQHQNPDNPLAHELTTGPELWEQLDGKIDAVVVALGTCGTFDGVTRFLKSKNPAIKVFGVEPAGSPLYSGGKQGSHKIYGMGPGLITEIFERAEIKPDEIITVTDEDAYEWTRRVAHREGLLVGLTSGALAWSAGQVAERPEFAGKAIVTFFYDTGERYLSIPDLFPAGDIETVPASSAPARNKTQEREETDQMEEIIPDTRTMPPGPFAMACRRGELVFVSGQVAFDGEKGEAVQGGIEEQTRQTLKNLKSVLETAGSSLDEVIKLNCILPNFPTDYVGFNEVFKEFFPGPRYPARTSIQAGLLGGFLVEIEAIAVCRD